MESKAVGEHAVYVVVPWVANYVRRIQQSPGAILDKDLAGAMGATGTNWTQLPKALRALGIIDDEGRLTPDIGMNLAAGGERGKEAAVAVLERGYATLFSRLKRGEPLRSEVLDNHFFDVSKAERGTPLAVSARRQAAALFRYWVEQTGNEEWIKAVGRARAETKPQPATRRREPPRSVGPTRTRSVSVAVAPTDQHQYDAVLTVQTPLYAVRIEAARGQALTLEDWEQAKTDISAHIDYIKRRLVVRQEVNAQ